MEYELPAEDKFFSVDIHAPQYAPPPAAPAARRLGGCILGCALIPDGVIRMGFYPVFTRHVGVSVVRFLFKGRPAVDPVCTRVG